MAAHQGSNSLSPVCVCSTWGQGDDLLWLISAEIHKSASRRSCGLLSWALATSWSSRDSGCVSAGSRKSSRKRRWSKEIHFYYIWHNGSVAAGTNIHTLSCTHLKIMLTCSFVSGIIMSLLLWLPLLLIGSAGKVSAIQSGTDTAAVMTTVCMLVCARVCVCVFVCLCVCLF